MPELRRILPVVGLVVLVGGAIATAAAWPDQDDRTLPTRDTTEPATTSTAPVASPAPASPAPDESSAPVSAAPSSEAPVSSPPETEPPEEIDPALVARAYPVDPEVHSDFTPEAHANYQATDIFATTGCGTALLSPVTGVVDQVNEDRYDREVDDPALRGGNSVAIIGDDGVRYYLSHFQAVDPAIVPGARVTAGDFLGEMGTTGRSGACHLHFGLSLPCDDPDEWWVRRGVIWPDVYLDAWKEGINLSPLEELEAWFEEYPNACRSVDDIPYPHG